MKRKAIIPLVLGLVIGLLAVKLAVDAIGRAQASGQSVKTISIVQAKIDINAYDEIRPDMIQTTETVENSLVPPAERFGNSEAVVGRVTGKYVAKGSPILASMLAPEGTPAGLTGRIPAGFRASSVKIDETTSVGYQIKPGDWVDVIVVMDIDTGVRGKKETIAEVILQRVQVAAIGFESAPETDKGLTKVKPAKSATLLVRDEDVPKLHLASTRGKVTLAMRGDTDTSLGKAGIAYGSEIGGSTPTMPQAQPQPTQPSTQVIPTGFLAAAPPAMPTKTVKPPMPHSVMVFHGSSGGGKPIAVEQIVFESPDSFKILEVTPGAPTRAAAAMRGIRPTAQPSWQQTNPDMFPVHPPASDDEPIFDEE